MMMAANLPARFQEQMVIQSGYQDDTKEFWSDIWNTLMGYINADDSPNKLQQKDVLVDLMSQFLSRVAHDSKFYLPCTSAVLRASFEQANFQPLSAAQAFEALHEYAVRILAQPWRAEFTRINMYSGYYVHTVQSRLLNAHRLLEEMGFHVDAASQTATLREPVDVDQVTKAAIDALMASVECRIIERVLESLPTGAYTPLGVLCYRTSYVGGVEAAVHHLNVTLRQRNFQRYFSPPAETSGTGTGTPGQGAAYPWQPAPPAASTALPPVPTARLVDLGDRDSRENSQPWIPKTIRQGRPERPEPQRSPAAAALLPATLDEHQLASWDLVDAATAGDSLDDSWGYVLNSLDRRRPASGRYDNVPEPAGQQRGGCQRSATLPSQRTEPRAPPRTGRPGPATEHRQTQDPRPQPPLSNGSTRLPSDLRSVPDPADRQGADFTPPRPPPPAELTAPQRPPTYEYGDSVRAPTLGDSVRASGLAEHNPAPRGSLGNEYGTGGRGNGMEHNPAPRASLPGDFRHTSHQMHETDHHAPHQHQNQPLHQTQHQTTPQAMHQTTHQTPHQANNQASHQPSQMFTHHHPQPQMQHQASHHLYQGGHKPPHPQSLPSDPQAASRPSLAGDNPVPRSSSLVNDHSKTTRPAVNHQDSVPRSAPPMESRSNGNGNGGNIHGSEHSSSNHRRPSGQRPSPRPEPSPEPISVARSRASPSEPRRPELGAWPARAEPEPEPEPPSAEEQWSCHACTYLNPVSVRVCGMCGKSRQQAGRSAPAVSIAAPPVDPPDDLACPQCTLLNSRRARKCGACEADLQTVK